MKPLSSRQPPHHTASRGRTAGTSDADGSGGGRGGVSGAGSGKLKERSQRADVRDSAGRSSVRNSEVIVDRSSFPQWMKTLEDRWQKLHSKINRPAPHGAGARFNWVAKRLLTQRLARIAKNSTSNNNNNNKNDNLNNRCNSTAPNTTTYKHGLRDDDEDDDENDDYVFDVNDDCDFSDRPRPVTAVNTLDGEFLSVSVAALHNDLGSRPGSGDSGGPLSQLCTPRTACPPMRDGPLDENKNSDPTLAPAPDLVYGDNQQNPLGSDSARVGPKGQPGPNQNRGQQSQWSSANVIPNGAVRSETNVRVVSAVVDRNKNCAGGGSDCADSGEDRGDCSGGDGDVGEGGGRGEGGELRSRAWVDPSEMNGPSTRAVRTLNPLTSTGHMVRTAKTGVSHVSHVTTKSCPAALNGHDMGSKDPWGRGSRPSGRAGQSGRRGRQAGGMRLFAQMSVEARHAIETLREMGNADKDSDSEDNNDSDEEEEEGEEDKSESDVSLPSLPTQPRRDDRDYATQAADTASKVETNATTTVNTTNTRRGAKPGGADATSSVNAAVRGGRSPRARSARNKTRKKATSNVSTRVRPKSSKTDARTEEDAKTNAAEQGDELDLLSVASLGSGSVEVEVRDRTRFPAITSRTDPHVLPLRAENVRHVSYRLHGIGSYKVAREATFEITAPDFDIRYRDVITCQKGDRETPPPDIFDRSVNKVKEWLTKYYTPR